MLMLKSKFILVVLFFLLIACGEKNDGNRLINEEQGVAKNEKPVDTKICCLGQNLKLRELFTANNELIASFSFGDTTKFVNFNTDTYKWEKSVATEKVTADEKITTVNGKTIIKNSDNAVVFEQSIPSISDIESQTDIPLPNAEAYYNYFMVGDDRWDRKTIIVNVGVNKKTDNNINFSFAKFKSFLAEYDVINSLWSIRYLKEINTDRSYFTPDTPDVGIISTPHFIDSATKCLGFNEMAFDYGIADKAVECVVRYDDGELSLQKLYSEILPIEYADVPQAISSQASVMQIGTMRIFFDADQNMYVFYSDQESKNKYLNFKMYKADNPTISQHNQKIYWE